MSTDALQLVDKITTSEATEDWILNIEARIDDQLSSPIKPLQASIDGNSKERPSIYISSQRGDGIDFHRSRFPSFWPYVAFLTRWFGFNARSYLGNMEEKEHLIWSYYDHSHQHFFAMNRVFFLEHLMLYSCFLVFAIISFENVSNGIEILSGTKEKRSDPKDQKSNEFYILTQYLKDSMGVKCEMLIMDYQIPWFVVEAVYSKHTNLSKLVRDPINILAISSFDDLYPSVHKSKVHGGTGTLPPGGFKHLLHIFHWTRTPEGKYLEEKKSLQPIKSMNSFYIPCATDLQLSATVFEKHAGGSIDVSYHDKRLSGVMQLAPWHIFEYNIDIYKDLLTFEQRYEICGFPVTAYVACMVCLLRTDADVRLLRANNIIPSTRNNEKDVLHCVQEFKHLLRDDVPMSDDLYNLSKKVRAHHERSSSRCYADLKSRYCSNPWITISVFAAILLFVLTFMQTIYVLVHLTNKYSIWGCQGSCWIRPVLNNPRLASDFRRVFRGVLVQIFLASQLVRKYWYYNGWYQTKRRHFTRYNQRCRRQLL